MKEVKFNRTDFIAVYDEVYTKEQCEDLRNYMDQLEERSILTNESTKTQGLVEHVSSNLSWNYDLPAWTWLADNMNPGIKTCADHYLQEFNYLHARARFLFTDFKVKKIPIGGGFHNWHCEDSSLQYANRYLAVQIYLNDNFEGGETEFLYFNKRIEPKEGRLVIFPCAFTHMHRGNPPIGGTKYLATTWGIIQARIPL